MSTTTDYAVGTKVKALIQGRWVEAEVTAAPDPTALRPGDSRAQYTARTHYTVDAASGVHGSGLYPIHSSDLRDSDFEGCQYWRACSREAKAGDKDHYCGIHRGVQNKADAKQAQRINEQAYQQRSYNEREAAFKRLNAIMQREDERYYLSSHSPSGAALSKVCDLIETLQARVAELEGK